MSSHFTLSHFFSHQALACKWVGVGPQVAGEIKKICASGGGCRVASRLLPFLTVAVTFLARFALPVVVPRVKSIFVIETIASLAPLIFAFLRYPFFPFFQRAACLSFPFLRRGGSDFRDQNFDREIPTADFGFWKFGGSPVRSGADHDRVDLFFLIDVTHVRAMYKKRTIYPQ